MPAQAALQVENADTHVAEGDLHTYLISVVYICETCLIGQVSPSKKLNSSPIIAYQELPCRINLRHTADLSIFRSKRAQFTRPERYNELVFPSQGKNRTSGYSVISFGTSTVER